MFIKTLYSLNSSAYVCLLRHYVVQTRKCRLQTTETLRIVKTWAIRSNETLCIPNSSVLCIYCNTLYPKLKRLCSFETPCSLDMSMYEDIIPCPSIICWYTLLLTRIHIVFLSYIDKFLLQLKVRRRHLRLASWKYIRFLL